MRHSAASFGDFTCAHCHAIVSSAHWLSGVHNRNHCPYCLWSRHLDLYAAGDRLSACKGPMRPIGLTMKLGRNKYRRESHGELMLVHQCTECGSISINRIAADDDPATVAAVFHESLRLPPAIQSLCQGSGIALLRANDASLVRMQLYGRQAERSTVP